MDPLSVPTLIQYIFEDNPISIAAVAVAFSEARKPDAALKTAKPRRTHDGIAAAPAI